ncbi:MAG: HDIG domain-containing protein [Eubacteriales bacterium]|nr:HDIG domain-containing protein [Eubacteriales bacterium]MDD3073443.1 HDIG domain-containing protein [Eubacteriales bacterium]MDD4078706.1 HDIG domain-containing protein [Eubacteriales bacterium]
MKNFEIQVEEYMSNRCREHLEVQENILKRPLTFNYRLEHTRTAVAFADSLARELGVDPALAKIATWLHDIAKCWDPSLSPEDNRLRGENHASVGGEEAANYLNSIGFPPGLGLQVQQAIATHAGLIKDYIIHEPLSAIVWDADKLSKVSGAGMLHYLGKILSGGNERIDLASFLVDEEDWKELHQGIRNSFNTEAARLRADREMVAAVRLRSQMLAVLRGNHP